MERPPVDGLFYMKQTIGNACGTIAVLHSIGNNTEQLGVGERVRNGGQLCDRGLLAHPCHFVNPSPAVAPSVPNLAADGSFLSSFLAATKAMSPEERGRYLECPPPGGPDIEQAHQVGAHTGEGWAGRQALEWQHALQRLTGLPR